MGAYTPTHTFFTIWFQFGFGGSKTMLNLNDLSVFVTAAESKSFSEAGRRLRLSQPAVSQTIEKLEKEFGTRLFLRQGRRMQLSETGLALLPMARELLAGASRLTEAMACLHGQTIGEMVVGCSTASGKYLLPGLIASFRKLFPQVRIHVTFYNREPLIEALLTGDIALAVASERLDHRDLELQDFYQDEIILVAAASHPWAVCGEVLPAELVDEPLIVSKEMSGTRQLLLDGLRRHAITPDRLKIGMVLGDAEGIVMAVEEGIGVAFVSRLTAARSLELGRIVEVKVAGMDLNRPIFLVHNRRIPQTRAQASFWKFVTQNQIGEKFPAQMAERQLA